MSPLIKRKKETDTLRILKYLPKCGYFTSAYITMHILCRLSSNWNFSLKYRRALRARWTRSELFSRCVCEWVVCGFVLFYWSECEKAWLYKTVGTPRTYKENLLYRFSIDISVWFLILWCTKMRAKFDEAKLCSSPDSNIVLAQIWPVWNPCGPDVGRIWANTACCLGGWMKHFIPTTFVKRHETNAVNVNKNN